MDPTYSKYIKSARKLKLRFVTQEDLGVAKKHIAIPLFAFGYSSVSGTGGKLPSFSDGSSLLCSTEKLTYTFTLRASKIDYTPADYSRRSKWANRLIEKVGIQTAKTACFRTDVAAMVKVKKAIAELAAEHKEAPERSAARSFSHGTGRTV